MKLIIGNKNYSSWSLRAWLALRANDIEFEEVILPLDTPEFYERITEFNPSGKVPALIDDERLIWDSLAIIDYLDFMFPDKMIWPPSEDTFAIAKSMSAEMHSGFSIIRKAMPMNIRESFSGYTFSQELLKEINRVQSLWTQLLSRKDRKGPFLLGRSLTGADFMFAPMVCRFKGYGVPLTSMCRDYVEAVCDHPAMNEWIAAAKLETSIIEADEIDRSQEILGVVN